MAKLKTSISKCPHCGYDEFYVRARVSGYTSVHYRYDGDYGDNTHMWDYVEMNEQKTAYCSNCHKKIGIVDN
ncbi:MULTISPECIES: hypothetical protein [Enterobacterales]|uniref:Uncharacterized protein n=6 Tax=Enterobacterales TaxID=91347 RepID=A0A223LM80_MORMO|nr:MULTISPECIES: hypothetical protein [Enterobacterales]AMP35219.1 hypothetical protein [Enterobacter cloacae]ASU04955.1 Hypothetical protein [Klebsiella aerogenes]ASU05016.1 Hypothetical protein [Proteus mirabilis]ASU05077.1 Hypothetical protein [Morganella morganii]ASU05303.1 Hypothetical protein [Serratia marcescens]